MSAVPAVDAGTRRRNRRLALWISAGVLAVMLLGSWYLCHFGLPTERILYH
ncbi:hypothetical protein HZB60_03260 [candidate division KSB1 bacterium]|nr:hypothetical protein [candidate division KSB1 bacterium]